MVAGAFQAGELGVDRRGVGDAAQIVVEDDMLVGRVQVTVGVGEAGEDQRQRYMPQDRPLRREAHHHGGLPERAAQSCRCADSTRGGTAAADQGVRGVP